MSSSKFLETAKRIVKENPEMFSALEEYDLTRKLPKISHKARANFTIDADILRKFRHYCQREGLIMSKILEKKMLEEIKGR